MIVDSANRDIVHHLLMYECNPTAVFDDSNLPAGLCDDMYPRIAPCVSNIATGWAVGGDTVSLCNLISVYVEFRLNRLWSILIILDIQLVVTLKSNIT